LETAGPPVALQQVTMPVLVTHSESKMFTLAIRFAAVPSGQGPRTEVRSLLPLASQIRAVVSVAPTAASTTAQHSRSSRRMSQRLALSGRSPLLLLRYLGTLRLQAQRGVACWRVVVFRELGNAQAASRTYDLYST
jgi:hypothetical protein